LNWGNQTGTLRWNHLYSDKLFSNTSLIQSNFNYGVTLGSGNNKANFTASLTDHSLKKDFDYYINPDNKLSFGLQLTYHQFDPGKVENGENSSFDGFELFSKQAIAANPYISHQLQLNEKIGIQYGIRANLISLFGETSEFVFDDIDDPHPTDTLEYSQHDFYKSYNVFEPRILMNLKLNENNSIKLA